MDSSVRLTSEKNVLLRDTMGKIFVFDEKKELTPNPKMLVRTAGRDANVLFPNR